MGMTNYDIRTLDPAPRMTETVHPFSGTYADAVNAAHKMHSGRPVRVTPSGDTQTTWHYIESNGRFEDRNRNSGVPVTGSIHH